LHIPPVVSRRAASNDQGGDREKEDEDGRAAVGGEAARPNDRQWLSTLIMSVCAKSALFERVMRVSVCKATLRGVILRSIFRSASSAALQRAPQAAPGVCLRQPLSPSPETIYF
jgi:hypothetical protein